MLKFQKKNSQTQNKNFTNQNHSPTAQSVNTTLLLPAVYHNLKFLSSVTFCQMWENYE